MSEDVKPPAVPAKKVVYVIVEKGMKFDKRKDAEAYLTAKGLPAGSYILKGKEIELKKVESVKLG